MSAGPKLGLALQCSVDLNTKLGWQVIQKVKVKGLWTIDSPWVYEGRDSSGFPVWRACRLNETQTRGATERGLHSVTVLPGTGAVNAMRKGIAPQQQVASKI